MIEAYQLRSNFCFTLRQARYFHLEKSTNTALRITQLNHLFRELLSLKFYKEFTSRA